jgi:hypothetical protein
MQWSSLRHYSGNGELKKTAKLSLWTLPEYKSQALLLKQTQFHIADQTTIIHNL